MNTTSIIMPPPVPTKPVPKPMVSPKKRETATPLASSRAPAAPASLLRVSGITRKRMPMQKVRNREKPPSTTSPASQAAKLPAVHRVRTHTSMTQPRLRSMFLCFM